MYRVEYDQSSLYIKFGKKINYKLLYSSPNSIEIVIPFEKTNLNLFSYSFYRVKSYNYQNYYSVVKIETDHIIPYELLEVQEDHQSVSFIFPLEYQISNIVEFYTPDNKIIAKLYYNLGVKELLRSKVDIFSSRVQILDLSAFEVRHVQDYRRKDLVYRDSNFWIGINGTYFAKKDGRYITVGGVVSQGRIISYPVDYRPPRGFLAIMKDLNFLAGWLPNTIKEYENFVGSGNILFLIQAGPLIYKDYSLVMDPIVEGFGPGGNNIVDSAPRSILYIDSEDKLNLEVIWGLDAKRKEGLNLYELAYYLSGVKHALNLDGGSSSCMYICNKKIVPPFVKDIYFNSQNYIVLSTSQNIYSNSRGKFYYYFPGILGYIDKDQSYTDTFFGTKSITFFDGYMEYEKIVFNDKIDYVDNPENRIIFLQTNDIDLAVERLKQEGRINNVLKMLRYYNCYFLLYE